MPARTGRGSLPSSITGRSPVTGHRCTLTANASTLHHLFRHLFSPPLLCYWQNVDVLAAPRLHPRRAVTSLGLTFRLAANTSSINLEDAAPVLAHPASWSCRRHRSST